MIENKRSIEAYSKKYGKRDKRFRNASRKAADSDGITRRPEILMSAYNMWQSLAQWREDIRRNEKFVFGDQHADEIFDWQDRRWKTERQKYMEQGLNPSQYNIIRGILRSIDGFWQSNKTLPTVIAQKDDNQKDSETLTATLHALYRKNELWKFDAAQLMQKNISGVSVSKDYYGLEGGVGDVVNEYIDIFSFFVDNTMRDPRYTDCTIIGCWHDAPIHRIGTVFSGGSTEKAKRIREMYGGVREEHMERVYHMAETFTDERVEEDFFTLPPEKFGLGRYYEVWLKESAECFWVTDYLNGKGEYPDYVSTEADLKAKKAEMMRNQAAMGVAEEDMLLIDWEYGDNTFWKYYYLTPWGDVLAEGLNPYWHGETPFTIELHDFYNGKIYPFVTDIIDTNKQVNKLSAISELLTMHSAKSLLFMPRQYISDEDGGVEEMQRQLTSYDGLIQYDAKPGMPAPNYVNTVAQAFTPLNVVNMYLKLSENVSGVYGALQGQTPTAGTPAQSFLQQSQNSATSLTGMFESQNSYRVRRDKKNVQLMQQFYQGKRYIYDKESGKQLIYDSEQVMHIDTEIAIVENTNTPAYRLMVNDILVQLKQFDQNNLIDLRGLIEVGNWPFKDKLLDYLNGREQEMREAMQQQPGMMPQMGGLPQDLQQEMAQYAFAPDVQQELAQLEAQWN